MWEMRALGEYCVKNCRYLTPSRNSQNDNLSQILQKRKNYERYLTDK